MAQNYIFIHTFIADPWRDLRALHFLKMSTRERRNHYKCRNQFLRLKDIEIFPEMEKRLNNVKLDRKFIIVTEIHRKAYFPKYTTHPF